MKVLTFLKLFKLLKLLKLLKLFQLLKFIIIIIFWKYFEHFWFILIYFCLFSLLFYILKEHSMLRCQCPIYNRTLKSFDQVWIRYPYFVKLKCVCSDGTHGFSTKGACALWRNNGEIHRKRRYLKGTIVNRKYLSLHEGSREIMLKLYLILQQSFIRLFHLLHFSSDFIYMR